MSKIFTEDENKAWQRTLPSKLSSACIAFRCNDKVLMVKACYKNYWTFSGGIVDENESPKEAAVREVYEEVGIKLDKNKVQFLTTIYTKGRDGYLDRFNFVFIVDCINEETKYILQKEEIEKFEWVDICKIAEYSKQKGSYQNIQRILQNKIQNEAYIEVL